MAVVPSSGNLRRLLVTCVQDHDWSEPPPALAGVDVSILPVDFVRAAVSHRVAGCAYRSLSAAGARGPALQALGSHYTRALANHLQSLSDMKVAGAALDHAGIPWLVAKGPVLAELYYPDPALRSYFDLDLIVQPQHMRRAIDVLEEAGCDLLDQGWISNRRTLSVEVELLLPNGTRCDLHWHLLNDTALRRAIALPMPDLFERARTVTLGPGVVARTLDREDTFMHLALHAVVSGGNRLVWMKDIEQAALLRPDWDVVVDRVRAARLALPIGTMLARTRKTLGSPIPADVVRELAPPRAWTHLVGASQVLSDFAEPTLSAPSSAILRSSHPGLASSCGQLLSRVVRGVWRRARLRKRGMPTDAAGERHMIRLEGAVGQRTRVAYCDAVEHFNRELAS